MLKENTSPELQLLLQFLPSNHMLSNSINHFGENTSPNGYLISECRNHAKENTCPELKLLPQLPANDYLISESRNHVEENSSLDYCNFYQVTTQFLNLAIMLNKKNSPRIAVTATVFTK